MAERSTTYLQERKMLAIFNQKSILLLHMVAFLLGRAGILGTLTPFGIGFYTALCLKNKKYITVAVVTLMGIMTVQGVNGSIPYGITLGAIVLAFNYFLSTRKYRVISVAFISGSIYLVVATTFILINNFYLYDLMMAVFEALVIFVVVYISSFAIPIALQKNHRKILATEEIICVAILMALTLSGVNDVEVLGVSLKNILGILITIIFAYNGGASVGASVGVTLGLITSMSTNGMPPIIIGIFAFSGLLAGIFKDLGKFGSAFGFLLGNTILTFYINGYYEVFIQLKEVLGAFVLFLIIPGSWILQLQKYSSPALGIIHSSRSYGDEMKKRIYEKLSDFSQTFSDLSVTFENMAERVEAFGQDDLSKLIEKMAEGVCRDCGMRRNCWESNFYNTYQGMSDLLVLIDTREQLDSKSLPDQIKKRCVRPKAVIEKMITLYDLSRVNMIWRKRLLEGKELVGEQLKGMANGIQSLAEELNSEIVFDTELEDSIYVELDKAGLSVNRLLVSTNEKGKLEVTIERRPCYGREDCVENYIPVISRAVGYQLSKKNHKCNNPHSHGSCSFTLVEANKYAALTKVARATNEGNLLSGDSYTFMEIKNNEFLVALSDGMGTGEKAHLQSSATIAMLEKMMEAGFRQEMTIKTINSMLMLKSSEEIFSTIDMTTIDLHEGRAEFAKIGSAPGYIKRSDGKVEVINPASLPIGILSDIDVEQNYKNLQDGDFIIMISDGIIEVNKEEGEDWVVKYLKESVTRNPQELADKILHQALQYTGNKPEDDMTVLVTKVWKTRVQ
ncbi:stage II sporulation protein E [Alkaliphilus hydrothermalis]|uniref:Stage II sporulation protein E n=1 Tax=Alkaliphilus hydrothermalis TaxID=1482730 RepID=A0ABS2NPG0_9FIRM|nr:stage II sporulation protein E [Alkaliphilus hydrothermalis]MBM7614794.1 stage II sporulation protein E [Alkaliphilus hydrothermalis]